MTKQLSINELKLEIAGLLAEARKKKAEPKKRGRSVEAYGFFDEALDFSTPLGAFNLYRQQGVSNLGPYTADGPWIDSHFASPRVGPTGIAEADERALRALVREVIENGLVPSDSAWGPLTEREEPAFESIWEAAMHYYDHQGLGLGKQTPDGIEKRKAKYQKEQGT
jgi:hypothetical protein